MAYQIKSLQCEQNVGCLKNLGMNLCPFTLTTFFFLSAPLRPLNFNPNLLILESPRSPSLLASSSAMNSRVRHTRLEQEERAIVRRRRRRRSLCLRARQMSILRCSLAKACFRVRRIPLCCPSYSRTCRLHQEAVCMRGKDRRYRGVWMVAQAPKPTLGTYHYYHFIGETTLTQ